MARLAIATGTRAEYGIFRPLLRAFQERGWDFDLLVTGAHLSKAHGWTVSEIEGDGFPIAERVDIGLDDDDPASVAAVMGRATAAFGSVLARLKPDLLFLLGDRYEALAIAAAAQVAGVAIAHLHGGEITEGAMDENFRHAITKLSRLHFVSTEPYRRRVIQLGEAPACVHNVGALGLDNVQAMTPIERAALEAELGLSLGGVSLLVTQHPVTLDSGQSLADMDALIGALSQFPDAAIVITAPNADPGSAAVAERLRAFAASRPDRVRYTASLGTRFYFGLLRHVDAVVGNSSSGLIEAPSFGVPTVNIGDRQRGRIAGPSVISVPGEAQQVEQALRRALDPGFRNAIRGAPNPYGTGRSAEAICQVLERTGFPLPRRKPFFDWPADVAPQQALG